MQSHAQNSTLSLRTLFNVTRGPPPPPPLPRTLCIPVVLLLSNSALEEEKKSFIHFSIYHLSEVNFDNAFLSLIQPMYILSFNGSINYFMLFGVAYVLFSIFFFLQGRKSYLNIGYTNCAVPWGSGSFNKPKRSSPR